MYLYKNVSLNQWISEKERDSPKLGTWVTSAKVAWIVNFCVCKVMENY